MSLWLWSFFLIGAVLLPGGLVLVPVWLAFRERKRTTHMQILPATLEPPDPPPQA